MLAQQMLHGPVHGLLIEGMKHPAHAPGIDARAYGRLQQYVGVAPGHGAGAGVKGIGNGLRPLHGDVRRQEGVGAADP